MRDDVDAELAAFDLVDGEADTVDRDRTLARHIACERGRHLEAHTPRAGILFEREQSADAIHMTRHQVPTQRIADTQRRLEIHRGPLAQGTEGGERQRLVGDISAEGASAHFHHRQTDPAHGDAVTDAHALERQADGADAQPHVSAARFTRGDPTDVLHDTGEHAHPLLENLTTDRCGDGLSRPGAA